MEYTCTEYACCIREEKYAFDGWSLNTGNFHCCAGLRLLKEELFGLFFKFILPSSGGGKYFLYFVLFLFVMAPFI